MTARERAHGVTRPAAALIAGVLLVSTSVSGCQTVSEHQPTAIGAGVGAASGAAIGGLATRSATGAVVGGLLGGLAGGAIGYYLERKDRERDEAAAETGYSPAQGTIVRVETTDVSPASAKAGDTVSLLTTYTVLTPYGEPVTVRETREVRQNGALVANPSTQIQRANGTFTSGLPIRLPRTARPGTYEVTTTIDAADRTSRSTTTFTVL
jgi:hypothetical protein